MERSLMKGNEALAEAAIRAGCKCFFGDGGRIPLRSRIPNAFAIKYSVNLR